MWGTSHNQPMCILFLAIQQHPDYPLIIAANRDEFHDRPSASMHYWEAHPDILAGRDLLKGGTWLGVNRQGAFAAVTNFRTGKPVSDEARSRGELVTDYLTNTDSNQSFTNRLADKADQYSPFNLVFGGLQGITVFCNQDYSNKTLEPGFHSISNGFVDQHWPKMQLGVDRLEHVVQEKPNLKTDNLNAIMHDQTQAKDEDLPETGVSKDVERFISSIFITGDNYGTRATSYLFYGQSEIDIHELNYSRSGSLIEHQSFSIPLIQDQSVAN